MGSVRCEVVCDAILPMAGWEIQQPIPDKVTVALRYIRSLQTRQKGKDNCKMMSCEPKPTPMGALSPSQERTNTHLATQPDEEWTEAGEFSIFFSHGYINN